MIERFVGFGFGFGFVFFLLVLLKVNGRVNGERFEEKLGIVEFGEGVS